MFLYLYLRKLWIPFFRRKQRAAARDEIVAVLQIAREKVSGPDVDFVWSTWRDSDHAVREIDRAIRRLRRGGVPILSLQVMFAPTGDLQEVSIQNGWSDEYMALADRFDDAFGRALGIEP